MNEELTNDEVEIDLVDLGYALLDKWRYLLISLIAGAVLLGAYSFFFIAPTYESTAKLSLTKKTVTYTGKKQQPKVVVKNEAGKTIKAKYYTVKVKTCKNAGTYKVTIIGKGKYAGYTQTLTYKIKAKTQKVTLKSTDKYTVKASAVKKSSKTLKKAIKVTKKTGKISYTTNNSKIKVNKNGKIVVAKGTKKGTYQVKVSFMMWLIQIRFRNKRWSGSHNRHITF